MCDLRNRAKTPQRWAAIPDSEICHLRKPKGRVRVLPGPLWKASTTKEVLVGNGNPFDDILKNLGLYICEPFKAFKFLTLGKFHVLIEFRNRLPT